LTLQKGKEISKSEREARDLTLDKSLIYGEVDYMSFARILRKLAPAAGSTFYDLGSGTGRAVFVARISQDFSKCIGTSTLRQCCVLILEQQARD
jgi:Histone methylation protein DOT1